MSTAGAMEWLMFFVLLPGIVLPFLWWWYAIRPDHVTVALTQNLGDPVWILYAGTNQERAKAIAGAVHKLTESALRSAGVNGLRSAHPTVPNPRRTA